MKDLNTSSLRTKAKGFSTGSGKKKFLSCLVFLIFTAVIFLYTEYFTALSMDEVWSFGFGRSVWDGLIPYKDFNMAVLPMFSYVMSPASINIHLFRIISGIVHASILYVSFAIVQRYSHSFIFKAAIVMGMIIKLMAYSFITYNEFMILFILVSFLFLIRYLDSEKARYIFLTGFFLSLSIMMKQSTGAVIVLFITVPVFAFMVKSKTKRHFLLYVLGGIIPAEILIAVSFLFGYTQEMIEFVFLGLRTFPGYKELTYELLFPAFVVVLGLILTLFNRNFHSSFAFLYIVGALIYLYPLFNAAHIYGYMVMVLPLLCVFRWPFSLDKVVMFVMPLFMFMGFFFCHPVIQYYTSPTSVIDSGTFQYVRIFDEAKDKHEVILEYLKDNENGLNLTQEAMFDSLSLDKHQGYADMINDGNLGVNGLKEIKESIKGYDYVITDSKAVRIAEKNYEEIISFLEQSGYEKQMLNDGYFVWEVLDNG